MGDALLRPCSTVGCAGLSETGPCPTCRTTNPGHTEGRGSASARGYGRSWLDLRARFRRALVAADIPPVCGARLPGAPAAPPSACQARGQFVDDTLHKLRFGTGLHTDHIVPHQGDAVLFKDLRNLQLLCREEHREKTAREEGTTVRS